MTAHVSKPVSLTAIGAGGGTAGSCCIPGFLDDFEKDGEQETG
jgi:hypothetical protein